MSDATCKTCPMWTANIRLDVDGDDTGPSELGTCHHVNALTDPEGATRQHAWFCSEHPLHQRDRLAAMMAQGILAASAGYWDADTRASGIPFREVIARNAYDVADAMLAERGEDKP